nr:Ig-like domain-containing protein [Synechococcus sp. MU1611]
MDEQLYQNWLLQLQTWAANGRLFSAGVDALRLKPGQATDQLKRIANRLAKGETRGLPPIEVLPGSAMPGAAGAYASGNNTIYLNANWLASASHAQVIAVLNEELGHHLDAQLNNNDTAGDEGELFTLLLTEGTLESLNSDQLRAIRSEQDQGLIKTPDGTKRVEFATINGTNAAETLTGTADADTITGGNEGKHAAGDTIYGLGGADTLSGGSGFDYIYGGGGADNIYAGSVGGFGDATRNGLFGGEGDDLIHGGKKQDVLRGDGNQQGLEVPDNAGNDELHGGNGHDLITGGYGNDFLSGGQGDDYLDGGPGSDIIQAGRTGDAKSGFTDYYYQHDGHSTIWTSAADLSGSSTLINGETITFANGTDVIYDFHHIDDQLYLPGTTFNAINGGDGLNNLTLGSNYFIQGTWSISDSGTALTQFQASNFSGSFTTGEETTDKDFLVLYNVDSENFFNADNTNFLILDFDDTGANSSSSSEPADMAADPSESLRELPIRITGPSGDSGDSSIEYSMQDGDTSVHTFTNGSTAASKSTYWAIVGGDDESLLSINETTGALSFVTAPDFDNPSDSNTDNTYNIIIRASYSNETTSSSRSTDYRSVDVMQTIAITIDNTPPTIAIIDDDADDSLSAGDTATLTFTLSEASTDFVESDIPVSGGTLSNWNAASATSYSATFTPTANSSTDGVISVASSKFSDSAGNTNNDGSDANNSITFTVDTVRPTIGITEDDADDSLSAGDTSTLTFTLSEASTDFVETDTTVTGGALSNWSAVSSTVYTATFTPDTNSTTNGVIHVANDKFSDAAGNNNQDETDANNTVTLTVDTTTTPTPNPSPSPSPSPTPTPTPTPETTSEKSDIYLLLDTSTSMLHSEGRNHSKFQFLLALEAFAQDAERAGYQFQRRSTGNTISYTQLLQKLAKQSSSRAIKELNNYTIVDNPNDEKDADDLDIHLITYNYHVDHSTFTLSRSNPSSGIDTMQAILSLKMAGEDFGNSIKNNSKWKELGLPKPNRYDLHQGRSNRPSNLYAGTELLGALEGLDYLLTNKANDPNRRDQSTSISLVLDGRPERRSWWDTRTNAASDSITGQAIPLPETLGKEDITTSGLLYDTKGNPYFFQNNQGQWQWKQMQKDLNAALDQLADLSTDPNKIQVNTYGLNSTGSTSLNATYQDLFSNQSFDNSSSSWTYSHQIIQSLQDLNL